MNLQAQRDIFRKLKVFEHAANFWQRGFYLQAFRSFKRNLLLMEAGLCSAWGERAHQQQALSGKSQVTHAAQH
jgi:hypothetical protein